jgi:hypothetical protein
MFFALFFSIRQNATGDAEGNFETSDLLTGHAAAYASPVAGFPALSSVSFASADTSRPVTFSVSDDFVYRQAYISINGSAWKPFYLTGNGLTGAWYKNSATGSYSIPSSLVSTGSNSRNFIAVYTCSIATPFPFDCHGNTWQVRSFTTIKTIANNNTNGSSDNSDGSFAGSSSKSTTSAAKIVSVFASDYEGGSVNYPNKTLDGILLLSSRWSSFGDGQWIAYALNQTTSVSYVRMVFYSTDYRTFFDIQYSTDNITWRNTTAVGVYSLPAAQGTYQRFNFTPVSARFIRIVGHGRSDPTLWNSIVETDINGFSINLGLNSTSAPAPGCTANVMSACFTDGDVYYYDSCNVRGAKLYDCNSSQTCANGQCVNSINVVSGTHPYLLANANELAAIKTKVAISGTKSKTAFDNLRTYSVNPTSEYWEYNLVESALKYAVNNDTNAANNAIQTMNNVMSNINPATFQPTRTDRLYDDYEIGWSMAVSYDLLYQYMTPTQREVTKNWLVKMGDWYYKNLNTMGASENNFFSGAWASLGMISLAVYYDTTAYDIKNTYLDAAAYRTNRLLNTQSGEVSFEPDGTSADGHGYINYGGDSEYLFAYAYERVTGKKMLTNGQAYNVDNFYGYAHTADGGMPNYGDNTQKPGKPGPGSSFYTYRMAPFALVPNAVARSSVWRFFWDMSNPSLTNAYGYNPNFFVVLFYPENIVSKSPREAGLADSYFFRDATLLGGNVALRTGWNNNNEITVLFTNRYKFLMHSHFDPNSFTLSVYGDRFIDDENGDDYNSEKHGYLLEHNTIVIDDRESPLKAKYFSGSVLGRIIGFSSGSGGSVARGDAKYSYADPSDNTATAAISRTSVGFYSVYLSTVTEAMVTPFQKGDRIVAMLNADNAPAYFVTIDNVRKDNSNHKYQWRIHTYKSISGAGTLASPYILDGTNADLYIYFAQPESFIGATGAFYSQTAGTSHNLLTATEPGVTEGHFFTIYYPRKTGAELPVISSMAITNGVAAAVSWSNGKADYLLEKRTSTAGTSVSAYGATSDGKFSAVRTSSSSITVDSVVLEEGTTVNYKGTILIQVTGTTAASASSSRTGKIASVDGQGITAARIYAPAADTLLLNGKQVAFTRDGQFMVYGSSEMQTKICTAEAKSVTCQNKLCGIQTNNCNEQVTCDLSTTCYECTTSSACNDNIATTTDSCTGTPLRCKHTATGNTDTNSQNKSSSSVDAGDKIIVFAENFESLPNMAANTIMNQWQITNANYKEESNSIVNAGGIYGKVWEGVFHQGRYMGGNDDGYAFEIPLDTGYNELWLDWDAYADPNFDPYSTKGLYSGKMMPGLGGGKDVLSGTIGTWTMDQSANGNGWVAHFVWGSQYALRPYYYDQLHDGQTNQIAAGLTIPRGQWLHGTLRIKMNTPGQPDGIYEFYVDGVLRAQAKNVTWRSAAQGADKNKIDFIFPAFFFGGGGTNYICPRDNYVRLDNMIAYYYKTTSSNYLSGPAPSGHTIPIVRPTANVYPNKLLFNETFTSPSGTIKTHYVGEYSPYSWSTVEKKIIGTTGTVKITFTKFDAGYDVWSTYNSWTKVYSGTGTNKQLRYTFNKYNVPSGTYTIDGNSATIEYYSGWSHSSGWTVNYTT